MRVLIVSPIASHPQNQGNSARITAVGRQLQALGHVVHFLYYPLEGLTPAQSRAMSACWDHFHWMRCDLPNTGKTLGDFYGIDDWYDPRLGKYAAELHERFAFDLVLVNYVWFSAVLDSLPKSVVKVIDTHDVFGDRHKRFEEIGLEPEWFCTTPEEERHGLSRADWILAIQDLERDHFMELMGPAPNRKIFTLGFALPARFRPVKKLPEKPVVGYLGSGNPFNLKSLRDFIERTLKNREVCSRYEFVLAGTICDKLRSLPAPFRILGRIDDIADFYSEVDIVINPMLGGTGLKIKSLEALSFGVPFLGTRDAMVGIASSHASHALENNASMVSYLETTTWTPKSVAAHAEASQACYESYVQHTLEALETFRG